MEKELYLLTKWLTDNDAGKFTTGIFVSSYIKSGGKVGAALNTLDLNGLSDWDKLRTNFTNFIRENLPIPEAVTTPDNIEPLQTKFEVCRTLKGQPVYVGDTIRWQIVGGIYENTGTVFYDNKECAFKIRSKSGMQCMFLPPAEYAIFEHANPADMDGV